MSLSLQKTQISRDFS